MDTQYKTRQHSWQPLFRQLLISSGSWTLLFILGLLVGAPTVVIPQLRKEANSTDAVSEEMSSWLRAAFTYACMPWLLILSLLITFRGLKITQIIVSAFAVVGYLVFLYSASAFHILLCEIIQGPLVASYLTVCLVVLTEFTSINRRILFLTLQSATFYWGVLVANAIGTFYNWRRIPLLGLVCSVYALATSFYWPESPHWLAIHKRFDECAKSHRWLQGCDKDAERELRRLISDNENVYIESTPLKDRALICLKTLSSAGFYKPVILCLLLLMLYIFTGKQVLTVYVIEVMRKITELESAVYNGMLILDGVTVAAMYLCCFITKTFKRRPLLLVTTSVSIAFLSISSLYLYLIKLSILDENPYILISLLAGFSVAVSCGPINLVSCICGELLPVESKGLSMFVVSLIFKAINGTVLKFAPYLFKFLGMAATFLFFSISMLVCLVFLYMYLPETKGKSLQEISDHFRGVKPKETDTLIPKSSDKIKSLDDFSLST